MNKKKTTKDDERKRGDIVIYRSQAGPDIEVRLEKNNIWLDAHLIARLFGVHRPAIVKHIGNIYKTGELSEKSTCSKMEQFAADGRVRKMNFYNLDVIISVGYRVNSKDAAQFRIWATKVLKQYLVNGYIVNQKQLRNAKEKFNALQETVLLLRNQSKRELLSGQEAEILNLLAEYSKTLSLLEKYDENELPDKKGKRAKFVLGYRDCIWILGDVKKELITKKEASGLFGQERGKEFEGIIKGLHQTFDGKELYPAIEDKAAHLLYLTIKDHPFVDGNKRSASFLFVYFLDKSDYLFKRTGERKINDNALTTLALLIAESRPEEKDTMIRLVKNLISE